MKQQKVLFSENPAPQTDRKPFLFPDMPVSTGPFNLNCTTSKEPNVMLREIARVLDLNKVTFVTDGPYGVQCQRSSVKFTVALNHLDDLDNIFVLKFRKLAGELPAYKDIAARVLQSLNL